MLVRFSDNYGNDVTYRLDDHEMGHAFERLLPETVWLNKIGTNELAFTPSKRLSVFGAEKAPGGKEALCYHKEWNEVILFYGGYEPAEELYLLGKPIKGQGQVRNLKGPVLIEEIFEQNPYGNLASV